MIESHSRRNHRRIAAVAAVVCLALVSAGCGTRLSRAVIVGAARGAAAGGLTAGASGASGASGPGVLSSTGPASQAGTSGGSAQAAGPSTGASSGGQTAGASGATGGGSASAGSSSGSSASSGTAGSVINLGNVGTYSGVMGAIASGAQQTLQVWAAYTNAHGGLNGHPVHVYSADDGGDPSTSQTEMQQMVSQDHVIAFIGNQNPFTVDTSASYLSQQHIPAIGGDLLSDAWFTNPGVLFPEGTQLVHIVDATIKAAVAAGRTQLGVMYCEEVTPCPVQFNHLKNGGAQADGANLVWSSTYSVTQSDFTSQCIQAAQAKVNVIFLMGDANSLNRMATNCSSQNFHPLYEASSIGVSASVQSDANLQGMIGSIATFAWMDSATPAQQAYQQAIKQYAPSLVPSEASTEEWTSGMLLQAASKFLGAGPTSAQVMQGLYTISNNDLGGLTAPITFTANANPVVAPCAFYITLQNDKFVDTNNGHYRC